jgi:hypothetical protein
MLVTVSELADYMDQRFTNRQSDSAEVILAGLQSEVETFVRRPIEVQEFVENYHVPEDYLVISAEAYFYDRSMDRTYNGLHNLVSPPYALHLRQAPVISVERVRVKNRVAPDFKVQPEGTQWKKTRWGIELFNVMAYDEIEVTYTAGLDGEAIPYFRLVILRAASREMQNMVDDVVGLKDLNARQVTVKEIGLTESEKMMLKRYKRKQI